MDIERFKKDSDAVIAAHQALEDARTHLATRQADVEAQIAALKADLDQAKSDIEIRRRALVSAHQSVAEYLESVGVPFASEHPPAEVVPPPVAPDPAKEADLGNPFASPGGDD